MNSSLISLTYHREIIHPQLKKSFGRARIWTRVSWIRSQTWLPLNHVCFMEQLLTFNNLNQLHKMYVTKIYCDRDFAHFLYIFLVLRLFWPPRTSWKLLWTSSEVVSSIKVSKMYKIHSNFNKNAADLEQFRAILCNQWPRFEAALRLFCCPWHWHIRRMPVVQKLLVNAIEIQRTYCTTQGDSTA